MVLKINLLDGENIIESITPSFLLRRYLFLKWFLALFVVAFWIVFFVLAMLLFLGPSLIWAILIVVSFLGYVSFVFFLANASYYKHEYLITNKRIITKRGIIGYQVTSIPLERISDVIISRTFFETLCGISSLHIQSFAGQFTTGSRLGGEGQLLAISDPEATQNKILELVKKKRREEKLNF